MERLRRKKLPPTNKRKGGSTENIKSKLQRSESPTQATIRTQSSERMESEPEGVVSDAESVINSAQRSPKATSTEASKQTRLTQASQRRESHRGSASININSNEFIRGIPESTRIVHVVSIRPGITLSKLNLIMLSKYLDEVCGEVETVQHLRSGGLFITCRSLEQVKTLLSATSIKMHSRADLLKVQVAVAMTNQTVSGKVYTHELADMTLNSLLEKLRPSGVISVWELLKDPAKSHVPLYVFTFFGSRLPERVVIGRSIYKLDAYIQPPIRCFKCYRFGHGSSSCRSEITCRNCGKKNTVQKRVLQQVFHV